MATAGRNVLYLKTVQAGALKTLFDVLKDVLHDVTITFDASGMRILTMDGQRCSLIYLKLDAKGFEEYSCARRVDVGVNVLNFHRLIKTVSQHDTVVLFISEGNTSELGIRVENADKNSNTAFSLRLLDINSRDLDIPDMEFDSVVTMPSAYFQRLCRDMSNLAEAMVIRSEDETLTLECSGDFASQKTVIGQTDSGVTFEKSEAPFCCKFMLKFLLLFSRATALSNTMELFMHQDMGFIILKYPIASLGELRFCLAKMIDDDE